MYLAVRTVFPLRACCLLQVTKMTQFVTPGISDIETERVNMNEQSVKEQEVSASPGHLETAHVHF